MVFVLDSKRIASEIDWNSSRYILNSISFNSTNTHTTPNRWPECALMKLVLPFISCHQFQSIDSRFVFFLLLLLKTYILCFNAPFTWKHPINREYILLILFYFYPVFIHELYRHSFWCLHTSYFFFQ